MMTLTAAQPAEEPLGVASASAPSSTSTINLRRRLWRRRANISTTWKCINTSDGRNINSQQSQQRRRRMKNVLARWAQQHKSTNCNLRPLELLANDNNNDKVDELAGVWSTATSTTIRDDDGRPSRRRRCDRLTERVITGSLSSKLVKCRSSSTSRESYSIWALFLYVLGGLLLATAGLSEGLLASHLRPVNESRQTGRPQQQVAGRTPDSNRQDEERAAHWSLPNRPSLFSIIRFPNEECFDSSNQSGTCYTAFECKLLGGQPSSPCAAGFGSCCIVSRTCHVTTREKVVYFKNPSYPATDSDEKFCDLTVEMGDINVCQLRLDFLDFQLDPPTNGACKDDYMEISASGMPPQTVPRLCGMNRNQHLYINVPQDLHERSASIVFYTDPVGDHRWQVKVTQIDCNHYKPIDWKRQYAKFATSPLWNAHPNAAAAAGGPGKYSTTFASGFQTMSQTASALAYEFLKPQFTPRAPMGCLQYFTQPSGIIESFNFGQYLNNMDYSICIQRQPDTCRVVFTSSDYDWSLNGVGVSGSSSGVGDQDCARDYLLIPGGSRTGDGFTYDRYCGGRLHYYRGQALSAPIVMKTSGPIVLRFHSDAHFEGLNNGGFRLQYDQSAQDCIYHTAEEAGSLASQQLVASTLADSRPLSALINEAGPAMYASQQLSAPPVLQQLSHVELEGHDQHQQQQQQHNDIYLRPPDVGLDPNRRPQQHSTGHQVGQTNNDTTQTAFYQINTDRSDNIKRNDYDGDPANLQRPAAAVALSLFGKTLAPNRNDRTTGHLLTPLDLTKAFQLITARSARWLTSTAAAVAAADQ